MSRTAAAKVRAAEQLPAAAVSEAEWQAWVEDRAAQAGWLLTFHVLRAQVKGRWLTNTSSPGVPDLWLLRPATGQLLVLELKRLGGTARPGQEAWVAGLNTVPGVTAAFADPTDARAVLHLLARPRVAR